MFAIDGFGTGWFLKVTQDFIPFFEKWYFCLWKKAIQRNL